MKILGLVEREATTSEKAENKRIIQEIQERRPPHRVRGTAWRIVLDDPLQEDEYPNSWVGRETDWDPNGQLVQLRFGKHYVGTDFRGKPQRKTDRAMRIWVPAWLLQKEKAQ